MNEQATPAENSRLGAVRARIVRVVRGAPVSVGAVVLLWALALATDSVLTVSHHVERNFATGIVPVEDGRWWTPFTAGLWAPRLADYVLVTVLILAVVAPIERKIGSVKLAVAAIVTQVVGAMLGVAVAAVVKLFDEDWGFRLHLGSAVGPTTWIGGVVLVASSRMGTLWRRRVRVGGDVAAVRDAVADREVAGLCSHMSCRKCEGPEKSEAQQDSSRDDEAFSRRAGCGCEHRLGIARRRLLPFRGRAFRQTDYQQHDAENRDEQRAENAADLLGRVCREYRHGASVHHV